MEEKVLEEEQKKLKVLIEKAREGKIDLRSLKAIKKRGKFFGVGKKFKIFSVLLVLALMHGAVSNLFFTNKVGKFTRIFL